MNEYVYFEKQESALCGQHCLNNLLQGPYFGPGDLADIAHELDALERNMMLETGMDTPDALQFLAEESGNVDASGNFSIQVLNKALENSYGLQLTNASAAALQGQGFEVGAGGEGTVGTAFVLNRSEHWFCVRRLYGKYWNLNSLLDQPEFVSDFYLSSLLGQFKLDGYDVFVVSPTGNLPPPPRADNGAGLSSTLGKYYKAADLGRPQEGAMGAVGAAAAAAEAKARAPADPWAHMGSGHSLRSSSSFSTSSSAAKRPADYGSSGGSSDEAIARALSLASEGGNGGDDDDDELAAAIALSMAETSTSQPGPETTAATTVGGAPTPSAVAAAASSPAAAPAAALVLPPLPGPDDPGPFARVQLQGGGLSGKLVRKFKASDDAVSVFAWADACLAEAAAAGSAAAAGALAKGYSLGFGRETLTRADLLEVPSSSSSPDEDSDVGERKTMESMGLTPSAALTVRPI